MNKPKEQLCCLGYLITATNKWKAKFLNKGKYNTKILFSVLFQNEQKILRNSTWSEKKYLIWKHGKD